MKKIGMLAFFLTAVSQAQVFSFVTDAPNAGEVVKACGSPGPRPALGSVFEVDIDALRSALSRAPDQRFDAPLAEYGLALSIPDTQGQLVECAAARSPVMDAALAAKFPQIETYIVESLDKRASGRFEVSQRGLTAMLRTETGAWMIDPWQSADPTHAVAYMLSDLPGGGDWTCHTTEGPHGFGTREVASYAPRGLQTLRTLRLAMACTGEYGLHHCQIQNNPPNTADPLAAIVTVVARTNVVYEADMAVHFNLVANNDLLIFTDPATDPYANTCDGVNGTDCSGPHLATNITLLGATIGNANFDIGHVVTRIFGGVAYLSAVCGNNKAGAVSGIPRGGDLDPLAANVVIHEIGHQLGANHTFSGSRGRCAGNVRLASAWEAGSGSSPMAYAGACPVGGAPPSDNIVVYADPFFHHGSYGEMRTFLTGATCPAQTQTTNDVPEILSTTPDTPIPPGTPFTLSAVATDGNGDTLRYSWEQYDSGVARPLSGTGSEDNGDGSLFRIFPPVTTPKRTFPKMADVLSGVATPGEQLPSVTGATRRFRVIVRDNFAGAGGVAVSPFVNLTIPAGTSPFGVVSPAEGAILRGGPASVSWTVGGTNAPPIFCPFVTIRLSIDDGATFPLVLGSHPNTGAAPVLLPTVAASAARIRLDPDAGIFFAVSRPFVMELPCVADFDDGTGTGTRDGGVTIDDLLYYLSIFDSGSLEADVDDGTSTGTPDGGVTIDDLLYYLLRFDLGC